MIRLLAGALVGLAVLVPPVAAQEGIQRGKLKKADAGKGAVTITVDGTDRDFAVTPQTRIMDAAGQQVAQGLGDSRFVEGAAVMFKAARRDGKDVLVGLK